MFKTVKRLPNFHLRIAIPCWNFQYRTLLLCFVLIIAHSCKEESKKAQKNSELENEIVSEKNSGPAHFSVTLKALVEKDDLFELFFIQENSEPYTVDQMLSQEVLGSAEFQNIVFNLSSDFYPFNIRLDLGTNQAQNSIKIEACTLHYGNRSFIISSREFGQYFFFNEGVEMTPDSTSFNLKTFKEGEKNKYDPFLMGNQKLNDVLLKKL